jgi:hypothetical protein
MIQIVEIGIGRRRTDAGRKLYQVIEHGSGYKPFADVRRVVITIEPDRVAAEMQKG